MTIALTIILSLLCIFIGTIVLQNAENIHKLLKRKGCPCKPEAGCRQEQPWTNRKCCNPDTLAKINMRIIPNEGVKDSKVTLKKIKIQNSDDATNTNKVRDDKGRFSKTSL